MKKRKIKNYLQTGILLIGILTITTNCEKEKFDDLPEQAIEESDALSTQFEYLSYEDVPEIINAITSLMGKTSLKIETQSKTISYKKAHIDLDKILKVKDNKGIVNYTF